MTRCRTRELRRRTGSERLTPAILAKNIGKIYNIAPVLYCPYEVYRGRSFLGMSLLLSLALSMAGSGTVPPPLVLGKASHSEKASSRCQSNALPASPLWITCTYNELTLAGREVHWAQPLSTIERRGFALLFHGSDLFDYTWVAQLGADEYGLYYKVRTVQVRSSSLCVLHVRTLCRLTPHPSLPVRSCCWTRATR